MEIKITIFYDKDTKKWNMSIVVTGEATVDQFVADPTGQGV